MVIGPCIGGREIDIDAQYQSTLHNDWDDGMMGLAGLGQECAGTGETLKAWHFT